MNVIVCDPIAIHVWHTSQRTNLAGLLYWFRTSSFCNKPATCVRLTRWRKCPTRSRKPSLKPIQNIHAWINWLFSVSHPAQECFTCMETWPLLIIEVRPMLSAQGLWAGRDLYCATPAATRDLSFSAPINRLLRLAMECRGCILIRILTGPHSVASYVTQGGAEDLFLPGPLRVHTCLDNRFYNILVCTYQIYLEKFPVEAFV
jgi:hypothetical protein